MSIDQKLLAWYKKNGRNLPWRRTKDPYKILVSEMMLQQTQVPRVLLYYKAWLKQFPSWKSLAEASNADVIRAWAGLGYNRRALALRDIARAVIASEVKRSHERLLRRPAASSQRQSEEWIKFKGIGPYTSAALAVFTRTERIMPIDTNIRRVLDRVLLGKPFPDPQWDETLKRRTQKLLKRVDFDLVPQALFDLATLVCKKTPDCASCPLRNDCLAAPRFLKGTVRIPKAMTKKANETIHRNKKYPDRIFRGRILKLVREHPLGVAMDSIGVSIDTAFEPIEDQAWLSRMILRLQKDQMITMRKKKLFLA